MSGHSKWHNIKLRKGKQDAIRGKSFTRISKEIIMAAKNGGGNPDANLSLRMAIQKARDNSMPNDTIKKAIQRGTGEIEGANYDEITYEGYGPAGVAVLVLTLTDNRNRTVAELRSAFTKNGGNLGESGCVGWMFDIKGLIQIPSDTTDEDTVMELTMDAGAEDIKTEDGVIEVYTPTDAFAAVRDAIEASDLKMTSAELTRIPQNTVTVSDAKEAARVLRLMDALDDIDDVQQVFANFDIPDEIMQELG